MTWTPAYQTQSTDLIIKQVIAIVQRDQRAALDFIAGANVLPDFVTYQISSRSIPQFPGILIAPLPRAFERDAVGSRHSTSNIYCAVGVQHQDPDQVSILLMQYLGAMELVLNTLGQNLFDFFSALPISLPILPPGSMTTPLTQGTIQDCFVASHNLDEVRGASQRGFTRVGILEVIINREET